MEVEEYKALLETVENVSTDLTESVIKMYESYSDSKDTDGIKILFVMTLMQKIFIELGELDTVNGLEEQINLIKVALLN